jgi:hypothetical protein
MVLEVYRPVINYQPFFTPEEYEEYGRRIKEKQQ